MHKIAIAVHGGAGDETSYLKKHRKENEKGLQQAVLTGYKILTKGGSSLDAVTEAIKKLEDNELFNAGRGSVLNARGEVEMDASIMDGDTQQAGAASMVTNVKNPIVLARTIMTKTKHVLLSGYGALEFAEKHKLDLEPESYFITEHEYQKFLKYISTRKKIRGTVGAVALDQHGNLAAGTSTGGISHSLPGRVGDSCIIGAGCYANNKTCAVSGTGDGEILITNVIAYSISTMMEFKKYSVQKACDYVILKRKRPVLGSIGVIAVDPKGNIGISYCSEIMKRAWVTTKGDLYIKIYR